MRGILPRVPVIWQLRSQLGQLQLLPPQLMASGGLTSCYLLCRRHGAAPRGDGKSGSKLKLMQKICNTFPSMTKISFFWNWFHKLNSDFLLEQRVLSLKMYFLLVSVCSALGRCRQLTGCCRSQNCRFSQASSGDELCCTQPWLYPDKCSHMDNLPNVAKFSLTQPIKHWIHRNGHWCVDINSKQNHLFSHDFSNSYTYNIFKFL